MTRTIQFAAARLRQQLGTMHIIETDVVRAEEDSISVVCYVLASDNNWYVGACDDAHTNVDIVLARVLDALRHEPAIERARRAWKLAQVS